MINNIGTKTIMSERLVLRQFSMSDVQDMFDNWANSSEVCKFLSWEPHGHLAETKRLLAARVNNYQNNDVYNWAISLKEDHKAIGSISVISMSQKHQNCEIGYCIGEAYWGKGIATEALKMVMTFLFREVGMHRIQAKHDTLNVASGKVMKHVGMKLEGTMHHAKLRRDGSFGDTNIWALLADEWQATQVV